MPYDRPEPAHTETYRDYKIVIEYDRDPENPRKAFDNAATMVCFHGRYDLGDEHDYSTPVDAVASICGIDDEHIDLYGFAETLSLAPILWLPLYLYDHSGITMNTTGFSCPWDSGQVGFIYITKEKAKSEWPLQPGETHELWVVRVMKYLVSEVETYDYYLTGQVYGYTVTTPDGSEDDEGSCWGFIGGIDYCIKEAKSYVDAIADKT
jgi:hypothetical protein